ncbi:MAG: PHP domain-containing protein [Anaerolineae bacterium]|nr:PHP domain-containing protein [Anaerolineae bacterium]
MRRSTDLLILAADALIDLQVHTHLSDGTWLPEQLIDHLQGAGFALAAITDHDRVDTAVALQQLAAEKHFPLLVAAEMTTSWQGAMTDVLCFGFDPQKQALRTLAQSVLQRQQDNTRAAFAHLVGKGLPLQPDELDAILAKPSAQQPKELELLLRRHGYESGEKHPGRLLWEAGVDFATNPIADVVEAAHQDGAVCILAHPGRDDGFVPFDVERLDALRREVPLDGIEVYYPLHTPQQLELYLAYAKQHDLLVSSGSDSHRPDKPPIPYRAELSRNLLERLGIQVSASS